MADATPPSGGGGGSAQARPRLDPGLVSEIAALCDAGDRSALDRAIPLLYDELRAMAHRQLARCGQHDSLNSTGLVHEAYLKLGGEGSGVWRDRAHFFALASLAMRQILTDRARARFTRKRGGAPQPITLDERVALVAKDQAELVLFLDDALAHLSRIAPRLVRVVEFRFFGGMSEEEIGTVLGVTPRTVRRDWDKARLLLRSALGS